MNYFTKGLSAALCGLLLSAQAGAGALAELEALGRSGPGNFSRVYDNNTAPTGAVEGAPITQPQVKQLMLSDLDSLRNAISARYAPAGFKNGLNGWDLDAEIAKAKAKINSDESVTVKEYQMIVQNLFASMQDYHVSVSFHSTEIGLLPLRLAYSGGRYHIIEINRQALPEATFPFKVGDEISSFDGKSMDAAVDEYLAAAGMANVPATDRALAAMQLTVRQGSGGIAVPQGGQAVLGIKAAGTQTEVPYKVSWLYGKELIPSPFVIKTAGGGTLPMAWLANMAVDQRALTGARTAAGVYDIGDKAGPLPDLGEKLWEAPAGSLFRAYVYKNPVDGRSAGYVRIPTYGVTDSDKMVRDFAKIISEFNGRTDYLVIDQLNNPGGAVFYLYALAAMLTDRPLTLPKHRITLTQADIAEAIGFIRETAQVKTDADAKAAAGETLLGYPVSLALVKGFIEFYTAVIQQWGQGKTFTDPLPIFGLPVLQPAYGAKYAKPLMILTNELDFSGGDFFPAIMQDNKRAVTFGARTAGAGGVVKNYVYNNSLLGMQSYNLTATIALRLNGQPIESLGVTPDIPYAVQPGDLQAGFPLYKAAANAAAARLAR